MLQIQREVLLQVMCRAAAVFWYCCLTVLPQFVLAVQVVDVFKHAHSPSSVHLPAL